MGVAGCLFQYPLEESNGGQYTVCITEFFIALLVSSIDYLLPVCALEDVPHDCCWSHLLIDLPVQHSQQCT